MKLNWKITAFIALLVTLCILFTGCNLKNSLFGGDESETARSTQKYDQNTDKADRPTENTEKAQSESSEPDPICKQLGIPAFSGTPFASVNNNQPTFTESEITTEGYEFYSELDNLGRCGYAMACVGRETMPTEERGDIGSIKPTGWVQKKYDADLVSGGNLYNRCHLIGFQLTGENANRKNLITGTRYMNWDGMVEFENMIADYVKETGNHVMYRVTPMFAGNELVARGVHMEAYSVEDNGEGVSFNVYVYNVQPGIIIDYATGESRLASEADDKSDNDENRNSDSPKYILNTGSKKIHSPTCSNAATISDNNKREYYGSIDDLLAQGYTKCGSCKAGG